MCRSQEAAHISLPSMLIQRQPAANGTSSLVTAAAAAPPLTASGLEPVAEEEEEGEQDAAMSSSPQQPPLAQLPPRPPGHQWPALPAPGSSSGGGSTGGGGSSAGGIPAEAWVWRTDLEASAPYWEGWYVGLSEMFLKLPVPKVLVLVGTDRLDRSLTIGQMQGKPLSAFCIGWCDPASAVHWEGCFVLADTGDPIETPSHPTPPGLHNCTPSPKQASSSRCCCRRRGMQYTRTSQTAPPTRLLPSSAASGA